VEDHPIRRFRRGPPQLRSAFEWTGNHIPIRPVVLLPGWFVELHRKSTPEVWVRNPKMLRAYIEREPAVLKAEDVAVVASRIVKDIQK
jgi:hypothetical protein